VTVHVFFNPDLVGQLAACGITARRRPGVPASGFVVDGQRRPRRAREAVTNVIAVQGHVTITGPQLRLPAGRPTTAALTASPSTEPQTALELVEACARLRRDNQRLLDEVTRLRAEVDRLTSGSSAPRQREQDLDDSAMRFSLLELDL
jgi:hypothetical protein